MPPAPRTPSYRLHKATRQAVVTLSGRDVYLGLHGTQESLAAYDRQIAAWLASGRGRPTRPTTTAGAAAPSDLSVNEVVLAYVRHAESYYVKDGRQTSEVANLKRALRPLRKLYGPTAAGDFGPLALKAVRLAVIDAGLCRNEVNKRVRHVVRCFKWAVENEMVPSSTHHGLKAVAGLRRGRCEARESEPVRPVPEAFVDAIRPHVSRQVWAMVQLQRLTGMRPGEVCQMRSCDLDTSGKVWAYRPASHKTQHHGKDRTIYMGPRAQEVAAAWLRSELAAPLFSPAEAERERREAMRAARKTQVQPSQRARTKASPRRTPGLVYNVSSYGHSIARACKRAGVPHWHPHQLRHNAATWLRREFGLDVARVVLGHATAATTEIYAEIDLAKAAEVMGRVG